MSMSTTTTDPTEKDTSNPETSPKYRAGDESDSQSRTQRDEEDSDIALWKWVNSVCSYIEPMIRIPDPSNLTCILPANALKSGDNKEKGDEDYDKDADAGDNIRLDLSNSASGRAATTATDSKSDSDPGSENSCIIHMPYHYLDLTDEKVRDMFDASEKWRDRVHIYNVRKYLLGGTVSISKTIRDFVSSAA